MATKYFIIRRRQAVGQEIEPRSGSQDGCRRCGGRGLPGNNDEVSARAHNVRRLAEHRYRDTVCVELAPKSSATPSGSGINPVIPVILDRDRDLRPRKSEARTVFTSASPPRRPPRAYLDKIGNTKGLSRHLRPPFRLWAERGTYQSSFPRAVSYIEYYT